MGGGGKEEEEGGGDSLLSKESDAGLDPRKLRLRPKLKANL